MESNVYKLIELAGTSKASVEDAILRRRRRGGEDCPQHVVVSGHGNEGCH